MMRQRMGSMDNRYLSEITVVGWRGWMVIVVGGTYLPYHGWRRPSSAHSERQILTVYLLYLPSQVHSSEKELHRLDQT